MPGATTGSQDLNARCQAANKEKVDYFISLHNNCYDDPAANGVEVLAYSKSCKNSIALAEAIQDRLVKDTGMFDRGIKFRNDLCVLRETTMDACLVEMGFLSNKADSDKLKSAGYTDLLAKSIYNGIMAFLAR